MASDSFQLSPAMAKARFAALEACRAQKPDWTDPLFRPIDADDFRTQVPSRATSRNLTVNRPHQGHVSAPENVKLVDGPRPANHPPKRRWTFGARFRR